MDYNKFDVSKDKCIPIKTGDIIKESDGNEAKIHNKALLPTSWEYMHTFNIEQAIEYGQ